ncbi:MAG TPA: hypothetical protein VK843_03825 [Planctomycetota bacterium]|nr:hypothetical protein [Planctomycetota bacterium]
MDALALLCNLYGDGPATLKRLRVNGVLRIEDLSARPIAELVKILALPPATARRFQKEALALGKRVLDPEEPVLAQPAPRVARRAVHQVVHGREAILDAASRRWDELERASLAPERNPPRKLDESPALELATPLEAAELDRATHRALEAAGVDSLEQLVAFDSELLAHTAALGISQVLYAQGLARRRMRGSDVPAPAASDFSESEDLAVHILQPPLRHQARFSPSERPPAEFLSDAAAVMPHGDARAPDEGAGPFA